MVILDSLKNQECSLPRHSAIHKQVRSRPLEVVGTDLVVASLFFFGTIDSILRPRSLLLWLGYLLSL